MRKEVIDFFKEFKDILKKYQVEIKVNDKIKNDTNLFQLELKLKGKKVKSIGLDDLNLVEIAYLLRKFRRENEWVKK